jgi:hypothetical protein|tara:strand:- start:92 stop:286 length:195 start_codon:yes stop_codon:yes gene_type:complete
MFKGALSCAAVDYGKASLYMKLITKLTVRKTALTQFMSISVTQMSTSHSKTLNSFSRISMETPR